MGPIISLDDSLVDLETVWNPPLTIGKMAGREQQLTQGGNINGEKDGSCRPIKIDGEQQRVHDTITYASERLLITTGSLADNMGTGTHAAGRLLITTGSLPDNMEIGRAHV